VAIGKPILDKSSQDQKRSTTQILTLSDPKIRGQEPIPPSKRAHNPLYEKRGWSDQAHSRPPLRGPGGWVGDWYLWHAPDGLRARAATGLGCMQAGAEKLGVIVASYASTIIGVERRLALDKPVARSRQGITGDIARIKNSLRPFLQPATTCDPSEGPVRVARPIPWRAAAPPWPDCGERDSQVASVISRT
jgi:hypothetical protein